MKKFFKYFIVAILSSITTIVLAYCFMIFALGWNKTDFNNMFRLAVAYHGATHVFVHETDKEKVTEAGIRGIMGSLADPYSIYLDSKFFTALKEQTTGNFSGIGVVVGETKNKEIIIVKTLDDSPGGKAGLKAGDIITHVNGNSVQDLSLEQVTDKIKGPVNTKVTLTVKRNGESKDISITRETITYKTVYGKMLDNKIGYISISMFSEKTAEEFSKQLETLKAQGMKGLIIDLRDNPGGLLQSVTTLGKEILPAGKIVSIIDRNGQRETFEVEKRKFDLPMVALINHHSASAAEILAGALQDTQSAVIVGEKSYGKGSVQTVWPLTNGDGLKITIAKYYTPKMRSIDKVGVQPDVEVHLDGSKQDKQLKKAEAILAEKTK